MTAPSPAWEKPDASPPAAKARCWSGSRTSALREYAGKTLEDVAKLRGKSIQDTAMDLVVEDGSRVQVVYFLMSEETSSGRSRFHGSASAPTPSSMAPEGAFIKTSTHPRAYGLTSRGCSASMSRTSTSFRWRRRFAS
jgi:N-acyl-D-amino-acid deacylase